MHPKVSVITVCYNAEAFLERTIQSVIAQDYPNIEYVVIDGASKDNTLAIAQRYAGRIATLVSEPDKSLYDAMNKGIQRATGDYVVFMNAGDCIATPQSLSRLMGGSNNADLVYSKAEFVDENGQHRPWHKKTPPPHQLNARSFMNGMVICHQCMLVKRSIAPQYDWQTWKIAADINWSIEVMKQVKTAHFHDAIFCHFLAGGVSDKRRRQAVKERFRISVQHFGLWSTLLVHVKIAFQVIKRGSVS
jgi:glycosyltransferase involved in cell wall biosynthesis